MESDYLEHISNFFLFNRFAHIRCFIFLLWQGMHSLTSKPNFPFYSHTKCHLCPYILSWSITHSLTQFNKRHTYLTLGFSWNSSNTTMYCLDIKLLSIREKEPLGEQIKTMYIDGNNNATIKYQLFSLNVYVIQREFLDLTISYNELSLS